ncbi:MAG: hypothetical protein CL927_05725 [Deltaproteobacteria bacterium]|nr:hypothetical protein [Deltaproteobacteria bacterium]
MPTERSAALSPWLRSVLGAIVGGSSTALVLGTWPVQHGVIWTPQEQVWLFALGAGGGGLLGALMALGSRSSGTLGAVLSGTLPTMGLLAVPWIPVHGRTLLRADPAMIGLVIGIALVFWGFVRSIRSPVLHALAALVPAGLLAVSWPAAPTRAAPLPQPLPPDVLLITVDTTRADLVPGFHSDLPPAQMPHLVEWAAGSRRFIRAYAPTGLTGPSHTSILSGRHVSEHGIVANGRSIPPLLPMVATLFQHQGWRTQAYVSAAVLEARLGFDRGFDQYDSRFTHRLQYGHPLLAVWPRRRTGGTGFVREDAQTVDLALSRGLTDPDGVRPTFTWVHLYGPHWPYTPDPRHAADLGVAPTLDGGDRLPIPLNLQAEIAPEVRDHAIALYRAELRTLDDQLARLLRAAGPDTRIVLVADHGESLDEHGLLFNHGRLATTPTARVPVWVRGPQYTPGIDQRTVSLHQVASTLLSLAGLPTKAMGTPLHDSTHDAVAVTFAARSVFERDADADAHGPELGELASLGVREGSWSKTASLWHAEQWSNLTADPRELTAVPPALVPAETRARIERAWVGATGIELEAPEAVDVETASALEALGYIDSTAAGP